jgi:hypothetical protein
MDTSVPRDITEGSEFHSKCRPSPYNTPHTRERKPGKPVPILTMPVNMRLSIAGQSARGMNRSPTGNDPADLPQAEMRLAKPTILIIDEWPFTHNQGAFLP